MIQVDIFCNIERTFAVKIMVLIQSQFSHISIFLGIYYFSAIIIVSIATAMSVASLNLYHHGKHHVHPVPHWLARLFFIKIPKLLCMNIDLPIQWQNQQESLLKCTVKTRITVNNAMLF